MTKRKSDFTLPTLDDLFTTQAQRDDAKLERVKTGRFNATGIFDKLFSAVYSKARL